MQNKKEYLTAAEDTVGGIVSGTAISPQRNRSRPHETWEEQIQPARKPERKKTNTKRRAPARGRYIDEYARPAF
jgi:hypothetical protein